MGRRETVLVEAFPSWDEEELFWFKFSQVGTRRNTFGLEFPKLGRVETILVQAFPSWDGEKLFWFRVSQIGTERNSFVLNFPKLGRGVIVLCAIKKVSFHLQFVF